MAAEQQTRAVFVLPASFCLNSEQDFIIDGQCSKCIFDLSLRALCSFPPNIVLIFSLRKDRDVNVCSV